VTTIGGLRTRDLLRVHRLEYPFPVVYLCHTLWGAAFAVSTPTDLLTIPVVLAIIANLIPLVAQNPLNSAMDIEADARTPGKGSISHAAVSLGRARLLRWAAAEMAVALLLGLVCSIWLGRPLVAIAVAAGVLVECLYNVKPVRLKGRGYANPIFLGLHFSFLPCLGTFAAVRPDLPAWIWPLFVGIWMLLVGRTLWWAVPDVAGDAAAGDITPAVRYGAFRAYAVACGFTAVGLVLITVGLWWRYGPLWAFVGLLSSGVFLIDKLSQLRGVSDSRLPHETRMRKRTLTFVMVSDALLVAIPLVASA
jgi:lycopene elongase/hydratase (dihydrobisanhydrobacterioruberin-forming)